MLFQMCRGLRVGALNYLIHGTHLIKCSNIFKPLYKFCNILIPGRAEPKNLRAGAGNFGPVDTSNIYPNMYLCLHVYVYEGCSINNRNYVISWKVHYIFRNSVQILKFPEISRFNAKFHLIINCFDWVINIDKMSKIPPCRWLPYIFYYGKFWNFGKFCTKILIQN